MKSILVKLLYHEIITLNSCQIHITSSQFFEVILSNLYFYLSLDLKLHDTTTFFNRNHSNHLVKSLQRAFSIFVKLLLIFCFLQISLRTIFEPKMYDGNALPIEMSVHVNSSNPELTTNLDDNQFDIKVPVIVETDIVIRG